MKNVSKPSKSKYQILRLSTYFLSVSTSLTLERVRDIKGCVLYAVLELSSSLYLGVPAPWSCGGSSASLQPFGLVWSGVDGFVRSMWRAPTFMEKLLSGKHHQGDRKLSASLGGLAIVASQGVPGRDSVAEKRYS